MAFENPHKNEHSELASQDKSELEIKSVQDGNLEGGPTPTLTPEHREFLVKRHGTFSLDPMPSSDPADPYNWPAWKKHINLLLVSFQAFMTVFFAAAIIPAFESIAIALGGSLQKISYLASAQIVVIGISPLLWRPISDRFGRRPVWLVSTLCSGICNIGCAESKSYGALMISRILVAFFICPPLAIGTVVVTETFFKHERGRKMGIWTLMVTLGPAMGPFLMGFVVYHASYRWMFWTFAITNGVQFVAYFFLSPETLYLRSIISNNASTSKSAFRRQYLDFRRIDATPLSLADFLQPLLAGRKLSILIPTISYSIAFAFSTVMISLEIPQLFVPKFGFNPQQIGLQFAGIIIGTLVGEQCGGPLSDYLMNSRSKKIGHRPPPEFRLFACHLGFLTVVVGMIVFGVQLQNLQPNGYNVTPVVGAGLAIFGLQVVTTVLITYAVDANLELSSSIGVFVTFVRQTWSFIGPFWFPQMFASLGIAGSMGLCAGLVALVAWIPMILMQWKGQSLRNSNKG